uniref:Uncharacterized protein n=1 Tax=Aegilops tauschii subsp. strangulata TaxID=200361 RepID=A0A453MS76_AEGTS
MYLVYYYQHIIKSCLIPTTPLLLLTKAHIFVLLRFSPMHIHRTLPSPLCLFRRISPTLQESKQAKHCVRGRHARAHHRRRRHGRGHGAGHGLLLPPAARLGRHLAPPPPPLPRRAPPGPRTRRARPLRRGRPR